MFTHFIALAKLNGRELAYHFASERYEDVEAQRLLFWNQIDATVVAFSSHVVKTNRSSFISVQQMDPYFAFAEVTGDVAVFKAFIETNLPIRAVDVAAYIEQKEHLRAFALQKTLYYMYADFLVQTGRRLFEANFIAFDQGPVDLAVYHANRDNKKQLLAQQELDIKTMILKDGADRMAFIDDKLSQYEGSFDEYWNDPKNNPTHRQGTPWSIAHAKKRNAQITDQEIVNYHYLETV